MAPIEPTPPPGDAALKRLRLRYAGRCELCGIEIAKGTEALYRKATKTVHCIECKASADFSPTPLEPGAAGASAHKEYERRKAAREARVKGRLGNFLGGAALVIAGETQSTKAWKRGSVGEQKLAQALAGIDGLVALHDRRVPGTRGNIDHILVSPAGVFVVDAKHYAGLIRIRDVGGLFRRDERLYVGSRDCSELAVNMTWQVAAVRTALNSAGAVFQTVPIEPVLCFVDGEWPLLFPPESYKGVHVEGLRSIKKLIGARLLLDAQQIDKISQLLAAALLSK